MLFLPMQRKMSLQMKREACASRFCRQRVYFFFLSEVFCASGTAA